MTTLKFFLVFLAAILSYCEAYKVLVVFPMYRRSHSILGDGIVRHLADAGHEVEKTLHFNGQELKENSFEIICTNGPIVVYFQDVTYITAFPNEPASPNIRTIDVSDNAKAIPKNLLNLETIMKNPLDMSSHIIMFYFGMATPRNTLEIENVQKLINDPNEKFDIVIVEWMFSELLSGLAAVFDCPLIWSSSVDVHSSILRLVDGPINPAYIEDFTTTKSPPFTFWQRANNLYILLKIMFLKTAVFEYLERRSYDAFLAPAIIKRGRQPPSYYDVMYNGSLILANSHPSLSTAQSIPQNTILIGGYHIQTEVNPLPEDLKKILDNAENGVIYFSMGSNLKSKHLPKELKDDILTMFGGLKQTVLWKFEEDLPNRPKNVHILKWAPQQSILSHPNTVLFITHGGLLSTTETIHFGKPVIGIPVFADQFINVERAVQRGFAKKVELSYTMAGDMKSAIEEILSNPRYAEKAKELSLIYHDRPVHPGKEIVHWVEHVVKTRGALHLRSPALNVPLYQKLYLDLLAVILVILYVFVKLSKRVCTKFCKKANVNANKKHN